MTANPSLKPHPLEERRQTCDFNNLEATLEFCWNFLSEGAKNRKLLSHTPTLATVDPEGFPQARAVVLRACDADRRLIRFNSDRRSDKARDLQLNPALSIHIYDPVLKFQLRVRAKATVHIGNLEAQAAWATTRSFSRECYQVTQGPGTPIEEGGAYAFDLEGTEEGWQHFLTITAEVHSLESLYLDHAGHRRARFDWSSENWQKKWLVP